MLFFPVQAQTKKAVRRSILALAESECNDAFYILSNVGKLKFEKWVRNKDSVGIIQSFPEPTPQNWTRTS